MNTIQQIRQKVVRTGMGLTLGVALPIAAVWGQTANPHAGHQQTNLPAVSAREGMPGRLPQLPPNVPSWLTNT
ncbi:MAG: hypothetical protein H7Z41_07250, partial [Cytophagales bacterium]|nr:hypothetical protein [Armatimonadota bacterium]